MIHREEPEGADDLRRRIARFASSCHYVLEEAVQDGEDFVPALAVYRDGGDMPVAILLAPGGPGIEPMEQMEAAVPLVATGFDGDLIVLVVDTYHTTSMVNPVTGERWAHGEMSLAYQMGNPGGVIEEALAVCATTPTGVLALLTAPYKRVGTKVEWIEGHFDSPAPDEIVKGRTPQMMMSAWTGHNLVAQEDGADRALLDALLIRLLSRAGLIISTGEEEE